MEDKQLNKSDEQWNALLADTLSILDTAADPDARREAVAQLGLLGCVALKSGAVYCGAACLKKLLDSDWEDGAAEYLSCLRSLLTAAAKTRSEALFKEWLDESRLKITGIILSKNNSQKIADFLLALTFTVCDRRFRTCFSYVEVWAQQFALAAAADVRRSFLNEWINMTAQFARRQWHDVNTMLLHTLLKVLLRSGDTQLMQSAMLLLNMHLQMFSRWDSFASAFAAYKPVQMFLLIAVRRACEEKRQEEERRQYLLIAVRSMRDLSGNVARGNMQDDLEIIRQWSDALKAALPENLRDEGSRLVQLAIAYWSLTKPKTSRKQLEYLSDLLHPNFIDAKMQKIVQSLG